MLTTFQHAPRLPCIRSCDLLAHAVVSAEVSACNRMPMEGRGCEGATLPLSAGRILTLCRRRGGMERT